MKSIKRDVYVLAKDVSPTLTSDSEDQTGFPVQRSYKEKVVSGSRAAAATVCEQLNKIKSKTDFAPSPQDIELLDFLITEHGEQTVSRMIEWVLKGKNPYWRVLLKKSVFPCSRFTSSFNTMLKQIDSSNSEAMQKARRTC